jgi:hypothetical protein
MVKGSKAHLKENEGSEAHLKRGEGSEAHSKREVGLGNALPYMINDSKAHFKGDRGLKMLSKGR